MAEPTKLIIPKGTLNPNETTIVEIPKECEDSSILIARLQSKYSRPAGYYPPLTNPGNKFERTVGGQVVGIGVPPLSPIGEERHNYNYSLSGYGSMMDSYGSGNGGDCICATPDRRGAAAMPRTPSPMLSSRQGGRGAATPPGRPREDRQNALPRRQIFAGQSSSQIPGEMAGSPRRQPPRKVTLPSPGSDRSISDVDELLSGDECSPCFSPPRRTSPIKRQGPPPPTARSSPPISSTPKASPAGFSIPDEDDESRVEDAEVQNVFEDLKHFQESRRKLFFNVVSLQASKLKKAGKKVKSDLSKLSMLSDFP